MSDYFALDTFVFRRPRYNYPEGSLNLSEYLHKTSFGEAIYFASKDLYEEYLKYLNVSLNDKDSQRMRHTLIKYLSRMTYRCTPFGGFSLCGIGKYHEAMSISDDSKAIDQVFSIDSIDIEYLRQSVIKNMPNNELVKLHIISNETLRIHPDINTILCRDQVGCVRKSIIANNSLLKFITKQAKSQLSIQDLAQLVLDNFDISSSELLDYVKSLIISGVLISDLSIESLMNISTSEQLSLLLSFSRNASTEELFLELKTLLEKMHINSEFEQRKVLIEYARKIIGAICGKGQCKQFHLDSYLHDPIKIPQVISDMTLRLLAISEYLSPDLSDGLDTFRQKFRLTYEGRDMPLLDVLDDFVGIGFDSKSITESEYIGEIHKDQKTTKSLSYHMTNLTRFEELVLKKITTKSSNIIYLEDEDFFESHQQKKQRILPKTLSCMFKIVGYNKVGPLVSDIQFSGTSAANMLTRFAIDNQPIRDIVASIVEFENSDTDIVGEVHHITNAKYGNVQRRPYDIRDYSINYLSYPHTRNDHDIKLSDIMVSLKGNEIVLYSKSLKKRIIPFCTTAYNPMYKSSAIYRFLSALCNQYNNMLISFSIKNLARCLGYVPRIVWKNVILSPSTWVLQVSELIGEDTKLNVEKFVRWCKTKLLPRFLCYAQGDNFLVIDIESRDQIQIFLKEISNLETVTVTEFLPLSSDMQHYSSIYEIIQPISRK